MVLSFFELPEDERPAEHIWVDDDALTSHWEAVEQRREQKWGTSGSSSGSEAVPEAGTRLDQNELTAGLKDRLGTKRG